ncbi:hypothetical protein L1987_42610 [Smallanthus sonchifolius]|uniref:Uncharacterized protein n=1 Tax=Smallanthus sonchifolius TaxID=185202 RepID=A0ACB9GKA6_9ASTR|nr:hypothetical protein L1987_42610 [Smallanthus sonchifolius]
MHRVADPRGRAAQVPEPVYNGRPPLHKLLLSDAEVSLPCSEGAKAGGENREGYLCLGVQTNSRSELADGHVELPPAWRQQLLQPLADPQLAPKRDGGGVGEYGRNDGRVMCDGEKWKNVLSVLPKYGGGGGG